MIRFAAAKFVTFCRKLILFNKLSTRYKLFWFVYLQKKTELILLIYLGVISFLELGISKNFNDVKAVKTLNSKEFLGA